MTLDAAGRRQLFIEMASREGGATANDVHEEACARGDVVSLEAYHNLGRRLAHGGRLVADGSGPRKRFLAKPDDGGAWIDEDFLQTIVDPEHPIETLAVVREASRQARDIPADAWRAAAAVLLDTNAVEAAVAAITAYSADLVDQLDEFGRLVAEKGAHKPADEERARRHCQALIELLTAVCRDGLGMSREAVHIPLTPEAGARTVADGRRSFIDTDLLADEVRRRVEDAPILVDFAAPTEDESMLVAGVDGSTQGGLLSADGMGGDPAFGLPPQITLNTAAAVTNRSLRRDGRETPAFLRLPASPEDIQRRENAYTVMSPLFFPELSEAQYMHATWNAMDVIECRMAKAALDRWVVPGAGVEVRPADVVIRDGTIVPNDRDPSHYAQPGSYGRIVREMVDLGWDMARRCRDEDQTVAGAVKASQVRVFAPIANHVLSQAAGTPKSALRAWPLAEMNLLTDQALFTRLLSHVLRGDGRWTRTATIMRPFHATTPAFSRHYSRHGRSPGREIREKIEVAASTPPEARSSDQHGWADMRPANGYVQMLENVWFAGFYLAPGNGVDVGQALPRLELLVTASTAEDGAFPDRVGHDRERLLVALRTTGFSVAEDHGMYAKRGLVDFVPTMLQRSHEVVHAFAREMKVRAGEFMDRLLSSEIRTRRYGGLSVRPWTPEELRQWKGRLDRMRAADRQPTRLDRAS